MKKLLFVLGTAAVLVACNNKKDSLSTDKNIVVLTDTSRAAGSYLSDTGAANLPVAAAPAAVTPAPAPVSRTSSTKQSNTSPSSAGTSSTGSTGSTASTGSSAPAPAPQKTGISKAAKGAIIGGVGGAVAGAVIGKGGKGAIIGGAVGAAGGYVIGRGKDRKDGRVQ